MNDLASRILSLVGGKDNVLANATCMTRLRLTLRDLSLVDQEALRPSASHPRTGQGQSSWVSLCPINRPQSGL